MTETALPAAKPHEDRVLPAVVYALYLFGALSMLLTVFIGLIVAYANRASAGPRMASHYNFLIQTFWKTIWWFVIGVLLILFGIPLSLVVVGLPMILIGSIIVCIVGLWFIARCVIGLVYLAQDEPYPRPDAWLF
jgi:uncharacterized membrane protein